MSILFWLVGFHSSAQCIISHFVTECHLTIICTQIPQHWTVIWYTEWKFNLFLSSLRKQRTKTVLGTQQLKNVSYRFAELLFSNDLFFSTIPVKRIHAVMSVYDRLGRELGIPSVIRLISVP